MNKEIERQFALDRELVAGDVWEALEQTGQKIVAKYVEDQYTSYLYSSYPQVRIRKTTQGRKTTYALTIKGDYETPTTRTEVETKLTEEQYNALLYTTTQHEPIHKKCIVVEVGGRHINISTVDPGSETSFTFAEVEFPTEQEAASFEWPFPSLRAIEVTGGKNGVNPGKSMSMPEYWERTRIMKDRADG